MLRKKTAMVFCLIFQLTLLLSCEKPTETKPIKSVRDYTWTVDTLEVPDPFQNLMSAMYAANEDDIYLVGHNSTGDINGGMWHYDGKEWATVNLTEQVGPFTLTSIDGSSPNNVWAVGGSFDFAVILQYDGVRWKKHLAKTSDGMFGTPLSYNDVYSVYVESETEVWACGEGGVVYHYNGNYWDIDTIKIIELNSDEVFGLYDIVRYNEKIFITGVRNKQTELWGKLFLFKKNEQLWVIEDSSDWGIGNANFGLGLYVSEYKELYSIGIGGIFLRQNRHWTNIFKNEFPVEGLSIKSRNNFLVVGDFGLVFHYNGQNWAKLSNLEIADKYTCVWQDSDEAYIVGWLLDGYPQKTIVIHGK